MMLHVKNSLTPYNEKWVLLRRRDVAEMTKNITLCASEGLPVGMKRRIQNVVRQRQ